MCSEMIVTAWNNGDKNPSGAGYGVKLSIDDRDKFFRKSQKSIFLELEGKPGTIEVNVDKPSFWGKRCRELIAKEIGVWFFENQLAPWKKFQPPKLRLIKVDMDRFQLQNENLR